MRKEKTKNTEFCIEIEIIKFFFSPFKKSRTSKILKEKEPKIES
jgi:hypothetical protein